MPLQLDGQLPLTPMPAVGSSGMKRAMMVRLTEDSLDALSAGLGSGKYPQVLFQFDGTPAITIGEHIFPLTPQRETSAHELYRRAINTRGPSGLRMFGNVTGSFRVQQQDVSTRAQEKLRNSTIAAEQKKSERHTLFIDADLDPKTAVNGKKGKMSLGDNAVNRLAATKDARAQQQRSSMSTPVPSSNGPSSSSVLATTRIPPSRAAAAEQTRPSLPLPRPKLAKNAGAPPLRSHDGETLTSTFRGGMLTKETKKPVAKAIKDRPATADAAAPKASSSKAKMAARDWDGEPDDLPLAITTRTAGVAKTANGNARSSLTGTSAVAKSRESTNGTPLAKARDSASGAPTRKAANGHSTSSSGPSAAVALANAIAAASSASTASAPAAKKLAQQDSAKRKRAIDDEDYPAPGSKKSAQKSAQKTADSPAAKRKRPVDDEEFTVSTSKKPLASEAGTIKRKRALANDDDEYDGPGVAKKRKSAAASATPLASERPPVPKALNGILRKPVATAPKKEPSRSPNPPPAAPVAPVVTKLPRANDEPTLSKSLRFKKEERKVEIPTPNTSASSISVKGGPTNGASRRRSTPTFTSSEDEDEEAEEGELRPAKKPKLGHSTKPAPPKKPVRTWSPKPLPTDHTKLRARYHTTYVEYTYCQHVFATQRDLVQRRLERSDGAQTDSSDSEIIGEDELQKMKLRYSQVTDELTQIRKILYPEVKKE